nr:MAG TPA: tail tape measure protein [Caudoviricetes sp.]
MSAIPRQIAAVEFQADARQANQAIDSMKQEAEKCNKKVELLQERLQQGFKKITIEGKPTDVEKEIKNQQRLAKSYMEAAAALTKGAKAWDELWKHAATGNIEALTGQQIKAGVNGGKRQYDRLILGDDGDRRKALVIKEIIDQANIVLDKLKGSTNEVIETLNNGGHVADEVLQREKKGLEDMMQLTEKFSPEWQEYNRQLQAISKGLEQQIAQEKRLRGELVDANDARREAAKLDADVAQATKQRHEAQQKIIDDAQAQMKVQQEQLNQHKETAQKYADEISNQNRQVKAQEDVVNAIKRENNERNKKSGTLNKEAREAERTAETAKRAAEKSSKAVADTTLKISEADKKVADLQAQLKNLGNTKAKPVVDTEKIEKLKTSLKGAKDELAALMKDEQAANEKLKQFGITAADTADDVKLQAAAERALKMEEESRMNLQKKSVARQRHMGSEEIALGYTKLTGTKPEKAFYAKNKDVLNDEYWREQAGGGSIGRRYKYLQDISEDSEAKAEFKENVGMSVKDAMKVAAQRMREIVQEAMKRGFRIDNAMNEFDESYGKGPAVKLAEYVAEFYDLVDAREKEIIEKRREKLRNIQDIVTDPGHEPDTAQVRMRLAKEDLKSMASPYDSNISFQVKQQREEVASLKAELKELNETGTQSVDIDKERQRITEKLNKEKEKQTKLESDLQQQMQTAKEKIEASAHADEVAAAKRDALTKAQGEGEKKLQDESKKLTELQGKRNENIAALNREKEAIRQNNAAVDEQAKVIHNAQQTQAQNRQLSIESIEKAIELLRQENRVIGDETNPQWVENEKTIGRLNQRLSDMKQHAAELRGEVMSLGDAMTMAAEVSGMGGPASNNYSIGQMQQGIDALQKGMQKPSSPDAIELINESIDTLTQKIREAKGEAVSLGKAMEMADINSNQPYSIDEMQKGLKTLQERQNTAVDPSKYTEAIDALTQKIREAKGEAVSLRDAFRMGLQGAANIFKGTPEQLKQAKQVLEETLATTEKGSHRYEQLRRALDGVALEEKRVGGVTKEMQAVLDAPKGRSFNELKVAVEQGRKALNDMSRTTKEGQKAYDELAEKVRNADLEMKNLGNESKGTRSAFEKAVSRLKTYITLYMGTAVAIQKIGGAMGDMMTLSDKMGEVRKTTGFTADQVGRLSDNLAKLDTRTPIQDLMDMAAAAGQLGLNTEEDVRGFTEAANMLHVALPEMGEEGATEMMKVALATGEVNKIRKQMEDGTVQGSSATAVAMEKIASTIDRLRATTAAAAQPVADFVKRVGAVGAQSGISVDQVAALGATVDELGMGTEMAATAISRMIPAIKNHAFDIARAIGVTPKTIRDLYDSGKAMDVILMILQHIHDQNLNPDGIEKLLGTGGMGEIMKELDQQGARAGIVFAGLSQNVGELRKNLGTAKKAYADNIAIQQEYDKMNDTTAARWERLKNQLQEFFVNDSSQRFFGGIISALRVLVNFITDDGPIGRALRYTVVYLAMLKAKWTEAIGSGIMYLGKLIFTTKASTVASTADATAKAFETTSTVALGNANATAAAKTNLFTTAWRRLNAAQKANVIAAVAMAVVFLTMTAIKYVRQLASMTRAQKELNKVQDQAEVKAAEESGRLENLRKIVNDNTRSVKERKAAILEIQKAVPNYIATVNGEGNAYKRNTKLLTAYINKLKEKALVEGAKEEMQSLGKEVAHTTVEIYKQEKAIEDRGKEAAGAMQARPQTSQGTAAPVSVQARAAASMEILGMKSKLRSLQNKNREANDALQALQDSFGEQIAESDLANSLSKKGKGKGKGNGNGSGTGGGGGISGGGGGGTDKNNPWGDNPDAASTNWSKMNGKDLVARRKQMNEFVLALQGDTDVESVLSEDPALMAAIKKGAVKKDADSVMAWYDKQRLAIQQVLHSRALSNTGNWQDPKQAHRRAKSISKLVKDDMAYYMDELDAYYTEQKSQIEDAQNSGEITEEEGWRRMLQNEQVYRQKRAELQQLYSKNSKEVTQQEADTIYEILADRTGDSVAFIKSNIGTTVNLIKQVGDKSAPAMRKIYGDLDKGVEQDFLKMRAAVKKQLDAIEEIVSKERPFDGIVKNLRQNVEKMGLLYTDLDKRKEKILLSGKGYGSDEMQNLNAEYGTQRNPRLTFLLQQSEDAYNMTWERLVNNMRVSGFGDWADAILNNEHAEDMKEALLAQLHTVFDTVQDAIKKESSEVKKQVDIAWNDTQNALLPGGKSMKQLYEAAASALGIEQQSVSRANSLIGAGVASERVADKLAIKQLEVQLHMQEHYYALVRKIGRQRIDDLNRLAKQKEEQGKLDEAEQHRLDAKHAAMSLDLSISEEETELAKQRADLNARAEESQNRLYTSLKEWGTLLSSSMQSLFEASNTGAADYYNNLAKMRLTGEGSAGGTYVVIDNAGTKDAAAHYENLDGEEALKRQLEIEQHNSVADAWKKVMDDINKKISDQITDWMNASLQTQSIDANTAALEQNTAALYATRPYETNDFTNPDRDKNGMAIDKEGKVIYPIAPEENPQNDNDPSTWPRARRKRAGLPVDGEPMDETTPIWQMTPEQREEYEQNIAGLWTAYKDYGISAETEKAEALQDVPGYTPDIRSDEQMESIASQNMQVAQSKIDASNAATQAVLANNKKQQQSTADTQGKEVRGTKSTFAAMAAAMNMYGIAYQTMSNDNMSSTQKFLTFALQSAGQVAIAMLTTNMLQTDAQSKVQLPGILGKAASQLGPVAGPIAFAAMSALLGGLMGMAMSKVSKSKSQIAQVTGASVSAGRLSTGMLTYAEGNVNEFTDPSSLTPGQRYNVDAADGKTYRARYMGANPTTHLTNGPEFHLVGERGREAIIDANTTRRLQMNDTGIWQAIQTLYNGGRVRATRQRGGGMSNFADGNLDEFADGASAQGSAGSAQPAFTDMLAAIQASLDRNSEVMEKAVRNGIKGVFNVYGKGGIIDSYDTGKKNVGRYGEKY